MNAQVTITESGKRRRIRKRAVIAKVLVNSAAQGDLKAISALFNQLRQTEIEGASPPAEEPLSRDEDRRVMESIRRRVLHAMTDDASSSASERSEMPPRIDDPEAG